MYSSVSKYNPPHLGVASLSNDTERQWYDASEIGLEWKGNLENLNTVPQAKCAFATPDGKLKDYTNVHRCDFILEETIADNTLGKLVWAKRRLTGKPYTDYLVKKPSSQPHTKQEAVIQWLCNRSLTTHGLGEHCPAVFDIFTRSGNIWFSMAPVYNAPILDAYFITLPFWGHPHVKNGLTILKIVAQIAMCCFVLERTIGFNHRDLKPDNILVKLDSVKQHRLTWHDCEITVASSPTAVLVDFGFSCLGPGKTPWIQAGDGVLPPLDPCPKVGRDIFMVLVFLLWRRDVRDSLTPEHLDFLKSSLHLTKARWSQMMNMRRNPIDWIYMLITEPGFQCPALDPFQWLQTCADSYPDVVSISTSTATRIQSTSYMES